jgi:hypothetical protein
LYILIFKFFDSRREDRRLWTELSLWWTYVLLNRLVVYSCFCTLDYDQEGIKPVYTNSSLRFRVPLCTCYPAYPNIKTVSAVCFIFICNCITLVYFNGNNFVVQMLSYFCFAFVSKWPRFLVTMVGGVNGL